MILVFGILLEGGRVPMSSGNYTRIESRSHEIGEKGLLSMYAVLFLPLGMPFFKTVVRPGVIR